MKYVLLNLRLLFCISVTFLLGCQSDKTSKATTNSSTVERPWKLICLGDGLTVGAGLEPDDFAYPHHLADLLTTEKRPVSVVNAGLKGEELRLAAGRLPWIFQQRFDAFLLALGQGELAQSQSLQAWREDWEFLLRSVREIDPNITVFITVLASAKPSLAYLEELQKLTNKYDMQYLELPLEEWQKEAAYWIKTDSMSYVSALGQREIATHLASYLKEYIE